MPLGRIMLANRFLFRYDCGMNSSEPVYTELQAYRELPPFTLLAVLMTLLGWFLIVWLVILDRPLGALVLPDWLAIAIGLFMGVLVPLLYIRMRMVTEVYADRVQIVNGMTGRVVIPMADVAAINLRSDNIHEDYSTRNIGQGFKTRLAYTVATDNGVELSLADGRQFLIGSKTPEALESAVRSVWAGKSETGDIEES